jgi:hypothetical protein
VREFGGGSGGRGWGVAVPEAMARRACSSLQFFSLARTLSLVAKSPWLTRGLGASSSIAMRGPPSTAHLPVRLRLDLDGKEVFGSVSWLGLGEGVSIRRRLLLCIARLSGFVDDAIWGKSSRCKAMKGLTAVPTWLRIREALRRQLGQTYGDRN